MCVLQFKKNFYTKHNHVVMQILTDLQQNETVSGVHHVVGVSFTAAFPQLNGRMEAWRLCCALPSCPRYLFS